MKIARFVGMLLVCVAAGYASENRGGTSFDDAVIISVTHQSEVPSAEWAWIDKNLPGAKPPAPHSSSDDEEVVTFSHTTETKDGRIYSCISIVMPDESERVVIFDITQCFGK